MNPEYENPLVDNKQVAEPLWNDIIQTEPCLQRGTGCTSFPLVGSGVVPSPNDVLCGRGVHSLNNRGNIAFRSVVEAHLDAYLTAKTRREKARVVSAIISRVHDHAGDFIRYDELSGDWYIISLHDKQEKVGHALRDAKQKRIKHVRVQEKIDREQNTSFESLLRMQQQIFEQLLADDESRQSGSPNKKIRRMMRQDFPDMQSVWAV